ncbi:hypothetical protein LepocDRAFT_00000130 [Leptothrix ochracea L12]|uniref:Uncharacterized protein n=1 Tax=Leptothrix ochracea L12 TaxID=735332 RepID=I4Z4Z4_9BURK|nr:hypothetical protein LepocDRAFT_00000130 [Leptothrix ochracea L12]
MTQAFTENAEDTRAHGLGSPDQQGDGSKEIE